MEFTIDRPKANGIDAATSGELVGCIVSFPDDPDLHVAIVIGAGEPYDRR